MTADTILFYLLFTVPPIVIAALSRRYLLYRYSLASQKHTNVTGAAVARAILDSYGLRTVSIERIPGELSDHYDSRTKVLRLSERSYNGRNLAAASIAAHEAGHALQDADRYWATPIRQTAVPLASFGSNASFVFIALGIGFSVKPFVIGGIVCFCLIALLQIINLPIEYNASSRARRELEKLNVIASEEMPLVRSTLNAAALTYVGALLQTFIQILYLVSRLLGTPRNNR